METKRVVLAGAARTAIGKFGGALASLSAAAAAAWSRACPAARASAASRYHSWATIVAITSLVPVQIEASRMSRWMRSRGRTLV